MGSVNIMGTQEIFREIIGACSILTEEMKLGFGVEGLTFTAVDGNSICILSGHVPSNCFETYHVKEPLSIGIGLNPMKIFLSLAQSTPTELVEFDFDDGVGAVNLRVGGIHWILRGLDTAAMADPHLPVLEYDVKIVMDPCVANLALTAVKQVGELADFRVGYARRSVKEFAISVTLEAGEGIYARYQTHSDEIHKLEFDGPSEGTYALQFLQPTMSVIAKSHRAKSVSIQFQEKYPLRLSWITEGGGRWSWWLAPRVPDGKEPGRGGQRAPHFDPVFRDLD